MELLGIGSRIKHPSYGVGVIIRLHKRIYDVGFIEGGIEPVSKDLPQRATRKFFATFDGYEKPRRLEITLRENVV